MQSSRTVRYPSLFNAWKATRGSVSLFDKLTSNLPRSAARSTSANHSLRNCSVAGCLRVCVETIRQGRRASKSRLIQQLQRSTPRIKNPKKRWDLLTCRFDFCYVTSWSVFRDEHELYRHELISEVAAHELSFTCNKAYIFIVAPPVRSSCCQGRERVPELTSS